MQAPGGPTEDRSGDFPYGGWLVPHADADMGGTMVEIFSKVGAFLWPRVTDANDPIATQIRRLAHPLGVRLESVEPRRSEW
jgi:hypothetical protein